MEYLGILKGMHEMYLGIQSLYLLENKELLVPVYWRLGIVRVGK
jgi:hypothetical protein